MSSPQTPDCCVNPASKCVTPSKSADKSVWQPLYSSALVSSLFLPLFTSLPLIPSSRSTFLYLKFLVVWILVLLADFVLEFRFEYLWPFWLFIRSVYDSFRYQGLVRARSPPPTHTTTHSTLVLRVIICHRK